MLTVSNRGSDFIKFSEQVLEHIDEYTVPQYGDRPDDQVQDWDSKHCLNQVKKYLARVDSNQRPEEKYRDLKKMAHYVQLAHDKMQEEENGISVD